ncbi:glycoside hydrolase family 16 protein [Granulosicoccus sp. 3-233]
MTSAELVNIAPPEEIFDGSGDWVEVFSDSFTPATVENPDALGVLDWTRWSSRVPWGDWKINGVSNEDQWNVNTTGLEPGIGWVPANYFSDMNTFLGILESEGKHIFSHGSDAGTGSNADDVNADGGDESLVIGSYVNPWKKNINKRRNYVSGLISSHVGPTTDANIDGTHGFQFRYGYMEVRAKMPKAGNGFRSAIWLYSDNAYFNALNGSSSIYEIDVAEHIPNTRVDQEGEECFVQQNSSFWPTIGAGTDDVGRLSYDTIFNSYHYPGGRTSSEWTYNSQEKYDPVRCDPVGVGNSTGPDVVDYADDYHTYGVLWEQDRINFYVDRRLIHQVGSAGPVLPPGLTETHPITDSTMYIVINLAMGLDGFEGNVDSSVFVNEVGPKLAVDYVKVWQNSIPARNHGWCGKGGDATCLSLTTP